MGRPHGVRGEATVLPDTDDPERFVVGAEFLTPEGRWLVARSVKPYRDRGLLVGFEGVHSREQAETLRGSLLTIAATGRRELGEGEFWPEELVGLRAVDPSGTVLGEVRRVEPGPGQNRLVIVTPDDGEVLVPFVSEMVGDPDGEEIVVDAPPGIFP